MEERRLIRSPRRAIIRVIHRGAVAMDSESLTFLLMGTVILVAALTARRIGPDRMLEIWSSNAGSRLIGLALIGFGSLMFWTLGIQPIRQTLQRGGRIVLLQMSAIVMPVVFAQIGLIALLLGSRKDRFLQTRREGPMTTLQQMTLFIVLLVGFLVLFAVMKFFQLR
jgi:hypothetical protein